MSLSPTNKVFKSTPHLSHFLSTLHRLPCSLVIQSLHDRKSHYCHRWLPALRVYLPEFRYHRRLRPLAVENCSGWKNVVHAVCTPLAFSARHLQAYIILSLRGFLLCGAAHQSLSACLSFLRTLIMGRASMSKFPSSRYVGLHRAKVASAAVDGGGSVIYVDTQIRGGRHDAIFAVRDRKSTQRFGHEQF